MFTTSPLEHATAVRAIRLEACAMHLYKCAKAVHMCCSFGVWRTVRVTGVAMLNASLVAAMTHQISHLQHSIVSDNLRHRSTDSAAEWLQLYEAKAAGNALASQPAGRCEAVHSQCTCGCICARG